MNIQVRQNEPTTISAVLAAYDELQNNEYTAWAEMMEEAEREYNYDYTAADNLLIDYQEKAANLLDRLVFALREDTPDRPAES